MIACDETVARGAVIHEAMSWLRTPHAHGQAVKGAGVDCGRFLLEVYGECGLISEFDPGAYPYDYHLHRNEERYLPMVEQFAHQVDRPDVADIALFRFGRVVSHGAIVCEWPMVVHAYVGQGVVLDSVETNVTLRERLVGFWSIWPSA